MGVLDACIQCTRESKRICPVINQLLPAERTEVGEMPQFQADRGEPFSVGHLSYPCSSENLAPSRNLGGATHTPCSEPPTVKKATAFTIEDGRVSAMVVHLGPFGFCVL